MGAVARTPEEALAQGVAAPHKMCNSKSCQNSILFFDISYTYEIQKPYG